MLPCIRMALLELCSIPATADIGQIFAVSNITRLPFIFSRRLNLPSVRGRNLSRPRLWGVAWSYQRVWGSHHVQHTRHTHIHMIPKEANFRKLCFHIVVSFYWRFERRACPGLFSLEHLFLLSFPCEGGIVRIRGFAGIVRTGPCFCACLGLGWGVGRKGIVSLHYIMPDDVRRPGLSMHGVLSDPRPSPPSVPHVHSHITYITGPGTRYGPEYCLEKRIDACFVVMQHFCDLTDVIQEQSFGWN